MPDAGLRARVVRLLQNDFRSDDLTRLFLYARDRCDGRESVQEIGDFVAHHEQRNKGLVTRSTRDWFSVIQFMAPYMARNATVDIQNLPPKFPEFLSASLRRGAAVVKQKADIRREEAQKLLSRIISNLVRKPDGLLALSKCSQKEFALIEALCGTLVVQTAFDSNRLFDDFSATLRSHALLAKDEVSAFENLKPAVALFAVAIMHNCVVVLTDGSETKLSGAAHSHIEVSANVPIEPIGFTNPGKVFISTAMFVTDLDVDFCEPELAENPQSWNFDIEVTPNVRLGRLG